MTRASSNETGNGEGSNEDPTLGERDEMLAVLGLELAASNRHISAQEQTIAQQEREIDELRAVAAELAMLKKSRILKLQEAVANEPSLPRKLARVSRFSVTSGLSALRRRSGRCATALESEEVEGALPLPLAEREFDPDFYLRMYPDIASAGIDPLQHYLDHGKAEGRRGRMPVIPSEQLPEFELPVDAGDYLPLVSVIVPAFNHAEYLEERLESIYHQTYRGDVEVYLLDDASTDGSAEILRSFADRFPDKTTLVINQENSGSAFRQWRRGLGVVNGDVVWIAESDDTCDRNFLEIMVPFMANPAVMLAFSQTLFFEGTVDNVILTLEQCLFEMEALRFDVPWIKSAADLVAAGFADKNVVPNASGAIFRHPGNIPLINDERWLGMRLAGDWVFYLEVIKGGLVAYSPETTNYHRCGEMTLTSKTLTSTRSGVEIARAQASARKIYGVRQY